MARIIVVTSGKKGRWQDHLQRGHCYLFGPEGKENCRDRLRHRPA